MGKGLKLSGPQRVKLAAGSQCGLEWLGWLGLAGSGWLAGPGGVTGELTF
jgi:hypothetical protein